VHPTLKSVTLDKMCRGHVALHSHMCEYYNIAKKEVRPLEGIFVTHTARDENAVSGSGLNNN
jgi:hypothetical protein